MVLVGVVTWRCGEGVKVVLVGVVTLVGVVRGSEGGVGWCGDMEVW